MNVLIEGAGLAGQVLHRELYRRGVPSRLVDIAAFPRDKVCGGTLQRGSWEYLRALFGLPDDARPIGRVSHFWRGKKIARIRLDEPMFYVSRLTLDAALYARRRALAAEPSEACLRVTATGVQSRKGDWVGFQGTAPPVEDLEMHYGRGVYLGLAPVSTSESHAAFLIKKDRLGKTGDLKDFVRRELGVGLDGSLKGTKGIRYHSFSAERFAIGDAKLVTHPFLGLGMKHAIESARLLAELIASGRSELYPATHRRIFRRYRWTSRLAGGLYDSPLRILLKPILTPPFFSFAHRRLHAAISFERV